KASSVSPGSSGRPSTLAMPLPVPSGTIPIGNLLPERCTPCATAVTVPSPPPTISSSCPSSAAPATHSSASFGPLVGRTSTDAAPCSSTVSSSRSARLSPFPFPLAGLRIASTRLPSNIQPTLRRRTMRRGGTHSVVGLGLTDHLEDGRDDDRVELYLGLGLSGSTASPSSSRRAHGARPPTARCAPP